MLAGMINSNPSASSPVDFTTLLAEFDCSGQSAAAFARSKGLAPWKVYNALQRRTGKLRSRQAAARAARSVLLPVRRAEREHMDRDAFVEPCGRVRERRSAKLVETIIARAERMSQQRSTLPKSQLGKPLVYLDRQRVSLSAFLADPRIPIHNNAEERDLRHLAVGRKNWLVFASDRGGQVACRLYSLVLSCKQAGVDAEKTSKTSSGGSRRRRLLTSPRSRPGLGRRRGTDPQTDRQPQRDPLT